MNIKTIRDADFLVINEKLRRACFCNRADIVRDIPAAKNWKHGGGDLILLDNNHKNRVKYQESTLCDSTKILGE